MSVIIQDMESSGVVAKCSPCKNQFVSRIFLVDKPNGEKRFILNLKNLNKYIIAPHFKMEDHRTASRLISKGCFMASIDLKDAYHLVSIDPNNRKFLRFSFQGQLYEFLCLPFGLASAPFAFTKLLKPLISLLRSNGVLCVAYIDDLLIVGNSFENCIKAINFSIKTLEKLGFIINWEKSVLIPKNQVKFLGFVFDSVRMKLQLPDCKVLKLISFIQKFLRKKHCLIRQFSQLIGYIISVCPAVKYSWAYTKNLERAKFRALVANANNYDALMNIPDYIRPDLNWWISTLKMNVGNDLSLDRFDLEIFSDASLTGWGAHCNDENAFGWWTEQEAQQHINFLELTAIFKGLKSFAMLLRNLNILIRTDNTTALSYINKMGSVKFEKLDKLSHQIWKWCESRNLWLFASYINSKDNFVADELSRKSSLDTEWSLTTITFKHIVSHFGNPEIDLFASRENFKCERYVSWSKDAKAIAIDAFTVDWSRYFFFAFPPFSLILRCIQKLINDKAEGIFVVPNWPGQAWYPLFQRLVRGELLALGTANTILHLPSRSESHPLGTQLTLVAAKLSAKRS